MTRTFAEIFDIEPRYISQAEIEELSQKFWLETSMGFKEDYQDLYLFDLLGKLGILILQKPTKMRVDYRTKVKLKVRKKRLENDLH